MLQQAATLTKSDHYAHELIRAVAPRGLSDGAQRAAVTEVIDGMESDHYRTEVFAALLGLSDLSERDLLGIVSGARSMGDHYEAETLRKVVRHRAATDRVRDAAVSAAADLSRHYRDEVSRAAGRSD